jgi:hypothetical protein
MPEGRTNADGFWEWGHNLEALADDTGKTRDATADEACALCEGGPECCWAAVDLAEGEHACAECEELMTGMIVQREHEIAFLRRQLS